MNTPDSGIPSPREFLRSRRPERFSDSVRVEKIQLDRLQLEYHLDTITNRSEENTFERFARALAECEICPNLLPHTGPTGGGDSKADSETFPVADSLSLAWYTGIGREASSERWAFAFSAMKDWQQKVRSDVKKIAGTNRGYTKAFFITNQFVPDKKRAKLEDELRAKHTLDVRILDRMWILDAVFGHHRELLAIDTLHLPESLRPEIQLGPLDAEREQRLSALETTIENGLSEGWRDSRLAADATEAAVIARALDRPRVEVDGRFLRALDLAEMSGSPHERLDAVYQWAWTTFWWYEDFTKYASLVARAFEIAGDTDDSYHLELLTNLLVCLQSSTRRSGLDQSLTGFEEQVTRLRKLLNRVAGLSDRPGNALHAVTLLLQLRILTEPGSSEAVLEELKRTVAKARYLIGYPFASTAKMIREIGVLFTESRAYDDLFELIVTISSERSGEVTAAKLLLERSVQKMLSGDHLSAIRIVGRAFQKLYKEETLPVMVRALYLAGVAYAEAGVLWAARGAILNAASLATHAFYKIGEITRIQVACYERMMWLELQLGRLPQALEWNRLAILVSSALADDSSPLTRESAQHFDSVLGIHFLKASISSLRSLERLPDILEELGLIYAKSALLFALGQPSEIPEEIIEQEAGGSEEQFFVSWRDQPAYRQLRDISLGTGATAIAESNVLGCHVIVEHDSEAPATELAESILAAFEGLAATGLTARWMAHEPLLSVKVKISEYADHPFSYRRLEELGRPVFHVASRKFSSHEISYDEQGLLKRRLLELAVEMIARVIMIPDGKSIDTLIGEDLAIQRSIDFGGSFVTTGNVLGYSPKTRIDQWFEEGARAHQLLRSEAWDANDRASGVHSSTGSEAFSIAPGDSDPGNVSTPTSHALLHTISYIRTALWDRAGWRGVVYSTPEIEGEDDPRMYLGFSNGLAAIEIFKGLIQDLGVVDTAELLHVTIIRSISARNPAWYRVIIGNAMPTRDSLPSSGAQATMVSRIHTMTPDSAENLARFLASYSATGRYYLAPAVLRRNDAVEALGDQGLLKRQLNVRQAWEIGPNDPDVVGIFDDDDVSIPSDIIDAPVTRTKGWKRQSHQRKP
jgi:hypothetical protein